ncbi:MAG: hypothetical protein HY914_02010 [Desulfomonile tiedjei]|nr:hypothetical protein [Desulfomonile tiedjei]
MDILVTQIIAVAAWAAVVALMIRTLIVTGERYDSKESARDELPFKAPASEAPGYAACFERCLNDYLWNPRREFICKDTCAVCATGTC